MAASYFLLKYIKRKAHKKANLELWKTRHVNVKANDVSKCRICLKDGTLPIFGVRGLYKNVEIIAGIELSENDDYPKSLCAACNALLESAILLRETARKTDKILRQTRKDSVEKTQCDTKVNGAKENYFDGVNNSKRVGVECNLGKTDFISAKTDVNVESSLKKKDIRVQCSVCFGLLKPQLYKRHLERHQSASHLVCDVCGKMCRKGNLARHLQSHSFELPYQCKLCPYRGRFKYSLKLHMRIHTGFRPFSCETCQLKFLTSSNLKRHLLSHTNERLHKCIECGRSFHVKRDLDNHYKTDHVGVKGFSCTMCGNKYGTRKALMRHELRVHKRQKLAKGRMPLYLQSEYRKPPEETFSN